MGATEIGASLGGMIGGTGPRYRGFEPTGTKRIEKLGLSDLYRSYGMGSAVNGKGQLTGKPSGASIDPYSGPGLGFSPQVLETANALGEGTRRGEDRSLADAYSRTPYGTNSREYLSAQQGLGQDRTMDQMRRAGELSVMNEQQKRTDLANRRAATGSQFKESADLRNSYAAAKYASDKARFERRIDRAQNAGSAIGGIVDMAIAGGGMG
jgi:hypothetical protein